MVTHPFFSYSVLHAEPLTRYSDAGCPFCLHELSVRSRVSKTHLNPSCLPGQSSHSLPLPLLVPRGPGRTWFSEYESVEYGCVQSDPFVILRGQVYSARSQEIGRFVLYRRLL